MSTEDVFTTSHSQLTTATNPTNVNIDIPTTEQENSSKIRWQHVLILGGLSAFGPLSTDMYLPALPALSTDLSASMSQAQVTLSAGILGLALGQLVAGPISDAIGRKRPFIIGTIAFVLASLLCVISPNITILTILRFIQGATGAAGIVISLAIVRDLYAGNTMARFLSVLMLVNGLAPIIAPIIGSQLLRFTTWHGIFITLAIMGSLLLLAAIFSISETLPPTQRQTGGITATFSGFRDIITDRRFIGYALSSGFAFAAAIIYISVSPFILQNVYKLSPQYFGLIFAINALGIVIVGQINGKLVGRFSSQTLLTWGISTTALGGLLLLAAVLSNIGLFAVLPALFILVASLGLIMPNSTTLALANTRSAGSASALLGVLQLIIGPIIAPFIGIGGTTTPLPMALGIALFSLAALATFLLLTTNKATPA